MTRRRPASSRLAVVAALVALAAHPAAQSTRDATTASTGSAVLAGRVVADDTGRPVRRATVTVRGSAMPTGRLIMTDAEGRFAVTDLPAGTYSVTVSKPGWVGGYFGSREAWKGPGTPVVVGDGERRTDLDVRLAPGAVITGRVYDQFGQPQAGARVIALERRRQGGVDTFSRARTSGITGEVTDDRGEFRIYGLPPGEYAIGANISGTPRATTTLTTPEEVRWAEQASQAGLTGTGAPPPEGPAVGYSPVYYPSVTDPGSASLVSVTMGAVQTGIDVQLQFVRTASVRGRLLRPDGQPATGTPLMMTSTASATMMTSLLTGGLMNRITAGRDGGFAFDGITPGEYFISAQASTEPAPARGRGAGPARPQVPDLWAGQSVVIDGRDVDGLDLTLQPGLNISGRLAFSGSVLEPPENLERVSLRLMPAESGTVMVGVSPADVSADGTFVLKGVAPGRYQLSVGVPRPPGPLGEMWIAHRADIGGANAVEVPFEVTPGRDIDGVVIEFTDQPAELSGQVTDAEGRPVQGLTMVLFAADPARRGTSVMSRGFRTAQLDSEGRYRMQAMLPGDYLLAALAEVEQADLADPVYLEQLAASAIPITLTLGEKTVQDIKLGGNSKGVLRGTRGDSEGLGGTLSSDEGADVRQHSFDRYSVERM